MSANAALHINLDQARHLVALLEQGEQEQANDFLMELTAEGQSELFAEVGKLTRQLHDSLKNFQFDDKISELTKESIPDAKQRLNYVMEMTEQAANKTMDAIEASLPLADKLSDDITKLKPSWDRLMSRDLQLGEFKLLCKELDDFIQSTQSNTDQLHGLMTQVLMAQDYQDLTGQVIRRVIELVREVEDSLISMLTVFGSPVEGQKAVEEKKIEATKVHNKELDQVAEGPIIDAAERDDVVSGQDEVDDLLSSLGF
ncbi:protein phosphatase CheZ [Pseudoalteromonas tunicata]|uniref:Protein phosphatase CheZ n=1 Tax=Pseudoalteromonas tunicata D2 TaxID=87626 RepID=A4C6B5_9GAMM|nr:protein phosphatase CheZ [Pseudoalteromonas tunicata]ATC95494.1 chemotaxis protein CheZ [Pseudoalteromonas tunicata]AXT31068.1 protein phosphatase CheZ [Pseudoalteromonas tunicata]EAR29519.1 chemotaxis protein cheZ [Pseudoalteromonas tunicata D2]MDP4982551.1 protein phosphatase CheZ [Pseudoalteromonas tunicata]MDP5212423.1 protein phosphatase CheZ [Pseudoalteromonas tunicata]